MVVDGGSIRVPDPRQARTVGELITVLRATKVLAGDPSVRVLTRRLNADRQRRGGSDSVVVSPSTVWYCFDPTRRRLDYDLVFDLLRVLNVSEEQLGWWRQAWQAVFAGPDPVATVAASTELPLDVAEFTGRAGEVDRLLAAARPGTAPVVIAIEGMAGVGKTWLAMHAGHAMLRQGWYELPLSVDLHGFDPDTRPATPDAVLAALLRALGVAAARIPRDVPARARMYRNLVRDRRALVLLDNAATADQVRPLLPGCPGVAVLVTSRRSLAALDAVRLELDVLPPDDSVAVLAEAAGDRIAAEPDAAASIAMLCGHLPLALGLAAGQLRSRPDWPLADHAERLRSVGAADVTAALTLSYEHLTPERRRMFRLLTVHPGPDLAAPAAAALAGTDPDTARAHLTALVDEHLLQQHAPGRYQPHDLVREYAAARAIDEDPASERREALDRVFDYYLRAAGAAMDALYPQERHRRPRCPDDAVVPPETVSWAADPAAALAWLDAEVSNLLTLPAHVAAGGWPGRSGAQAIDLAATLFRYLDSAALHREATSLHQRALAAARASGDRAAQARALFDLAVAEVKLGRLASGLRNFGAARLLRRELGDRSGEAAVVMALATTHARVGRYRESREAYRHVMAVAAELEDATLRNAALPHLAYVQLKLGDYAQALALLDELRGSTEDAGDRFGLAWAVHLTAQVYRRLGRFADAAVQHNRALAIHRELRDLLGEAVAESGLGLVSGQLGMVPVAIGHVERATTLAGRVGDPVATAELGNDAAEVLRLAGRFDEALARNRQSLAVAREVSDRHEQARAQEGIAAALVALGRNAEAAPHRARALALYTELGVPEAAALRATASG